MSNLYLYDLVTVLPNGVNEKKLLISMQVLATVICIDMLGTNIRIVFTENVAEQLVLDILAAHVPSPILNPKHMINLNIISHTPNIHNTIVASFDYLGAVDVGEISLVRMDVDFIEATTFTAMIYDNNANVMLSQISGMMTNTYDFPAFVSGQLPATLDVYVKATGSININSVTVYI